MDKKLTGDLTKPHLRKKFKTVPMVDEYGKPIPSNPPLQHGGPWAPPKKGMAVGETKNTSK